MASSDSKLEVILEQYHGEAWNRPDPERTHYFEDLMRRPDYRDLHPVLWAFFQVGDLDQIKETVKNTNWLLFSDDQIDAASYQVRAVKAFRFWQQIEKEKRTPEREKDTSIRMYGGPDACRIYPRYAFRNESPGEVDNFWKILEMFFTPTKVRAWREKISQDMTSKWVGSIVSLTQTLRGFHQMAAFALLPVRKSKDNAQLELEFHWLAVDMEKRGDKIRVSLLDSPKHCDYPTRSGSTGSTGPFPRITETGYEIEMLYNGCRFTMKNHAKKHHDLPDFELLELQFHLSASSQCREQLPRIRSVFSSPTRQNKPRGPSGSQISDLVSGVSRNRRSGLGQTTLTPIRAQSPFLYLQKRENPAATGSSWSLL